MKDVLRDLTSKELKECYRQAVKILDIDYVPEGYTVLAAVCSLQVLEKFCEVNGLPLPVYEENES